MSFLGVNGRICCRNWIYFYKQNHEENNSLNIALNFWMWNFKILFFSSKNNFKFRWMDAIQLISFYTCLNWTFQFDVVFVWKNSKRVSIKPHPSPISYDENECVMNTGPNKLDFRVHVLIDVPWFHHFGCMALPDFYSGEQREHEGSQLLLLYWTSKGT